MKSKRLKVTITKGFEIDFITYCSYYNLNYRQYPHPLSNRFGVDDSWYVKTFEHIEKLEDMPLASLS